MQIVGIAGYSRSGKTSLINYLVDKHDYLVISTTDYLNLEVLQHYGFSATRGNLKALQTKKGVCAEYIESIVGKSIREIKIHVAENVIVPWQGRYIGIICPTIEKAMQGWLDAGIDHTKRAIAVEVYNQEELKLLNEAFAVYFKQKISQGFNIRRNEEEKWVDTRDLPFIDNYWNESSIELMGEFIHGCFQNELAARSVS